MANKPQQHKNADSNQYDILIIGGGINGAGIAHEAARRGYSVCLCDSGDFGSGTSSASTKLIHGGLRYLEHFEFRLVREALIEREILWGMAPHIIRPLRFVLPHHKGLRPAWLLRLGLFLYDHLGGRKYLPGTKTLNLAKDGAGSPLRQDLKKAFEYSDCWVEDSRLVILNLRAAENYGAAIRPRTPVTSAKYANGAWNVEIAGKENVTANLIVNAAGPWVDTVMRNVFGLNDAKNVRLVRGSHIVIQKKFEHDRAYIFQNSDERIIFAIPYEREFTLIGTTDVEQPDLATKPEISPEEKSYLCQMASEYFREPVTEDDIVWTYSGVRPLYDDGASKAQEATRDYVIRAEPVIGDNSLICIFGGKITTFRKLAQSMLEEIEERLGPRDHQFGETTHFPGGDFPMTGFEELVEEVSASYQFLPKAFARRIVRLYGTEARVILGNSRSESDLGQYFGAGLYEAEVRHLITHEWVQECDDLLYRRTKLGIHMAPDEISNLRKYFSKLDV
ncbi:MAG: glycerol-3-phosphate dehydrogenase [Pseudomonadota bacterium]